MRSIWDKRARIWVPADDFYAQRRARSGPQVITDAIDGFQSQADGKIYDSKSAYRRSLRDAGFIEVGNDRPVACKPRYKPRGIGADIRSALRAYLKGG